MKEVRVEVKSQGGQVLASSQLAVERDDSETLTSAIADVLMVAAGALRAPDVRDALGPIGTKGSQPLTVTVQVTR